MPILRLLVVHRTLSLVLLASSPLLAPACHSTAARDTVASSPPTAQIAPAVHVGQTQRSHFAGKWDTTHGSMTLTSAANRVSGSYGFDHETSTLFGEQDGNRFTFTYKEPDAAGEGWFEIAEDGSTFHGQWRVHGDGEWSDWDGRRSHEGQDASGFAGVWNTSFGLMRLAQEGPHVQGTYTYLHGSTIEGEVEGRILRAAYTEPDGVRGRALFELSDDGSLLNGVWRPDPEATLAFEDEHAQVWNGRRVHPVPGRVWLVILEAHWEGSLAEPEYSYGAMLRSFFERLPNVEVRHRFVNDKADFVSFCSELDQLVEPVVLYVSSHGSQECISAGADLIDGATIGAALRGADSIQLLHLGGCATLGGDMAAEIRAASKARTPFPISGFGVTVDWAGSAIVDFTYLDLVLEHGMSPAESVNAVRSMIQFAGPPDAGKSPIGGTDLRISELAR